MLAPFGFQEAIDSSGPNAQQFLLCGRKQTQVFELLKLGDQLRHDGHEPFGK